ncbi:MAG: glycosyltransferase family 2 protein [Bacteroidota bacterium]
MKSPEISILMPVYNGEKYLRDAIDSVLKQSYRDFELLIIDDGSSDRSPEVIKSYNDSRIIVIRNEKNQGLISVLNKGIKLAKGKYIARMDADDICSKHRLARQVEFMNRHKNAVACGSFYFMLLGKKKALTDLPVSDEEIRCFLLFNSPLAHPSAIIRKETLDIYDIQYSPAFPHAEDFDFWSKLSEYGTLHNIPEPLLTYRVHPDQITNTGTLQVDKISSVTQIRKRNLSSFGIDFNEEEIMVHNLLSDGGKPDTREKLENCSKWLQKLLAHNEQNRRLNRNWLGKVVLERWMRLCIQFYGMKRGSVYFYKSELYNKIKLPVKLKWQLAKSFFLSWKRKKIKGK